MTWSWAPRPGWQRRQRQCQCWYQSAHRRCPRFLWSAVGQNYRGTPPEITVFGHFAKKYLSPKNSGSSPLQGVLLSFFDPPPLAPRKPKAFSLTPQKENTKKPSPSGVLPSQQDAEIKVRNEQDKMNFLERQIFPDLQRSCWSFGCLGERKGGLFLEGTTYLQEKKEKGWFSLIGKFVFFLFFVVFFLWD